MTHGEKLDGARGKKRIKKQETILHYIILKQIKKWLFDWKYINV